MIVLNNSQFIGTDFKNLPEWLLIECLQTYGIRYRQEQLQQPERLESYLKNHPIQEIQEDNITVEQYRSIARFLNPNVTWKRKTLMNAFQIVTEYQKQLPKSFVVGFQTEDNPYAVNGRVLYGHCIRRGIKIDSEDSLERLYEKWIVSEMSKELWKESLSYLLDNMSQDLKYNLFQIFQKNSVNVRELEHYSLQIPQLNPLSCIIDCIKNYHINLMNSKSIWMDYITISTMTSEYWMSRDSEIQFLWKRNPLLLLTTETFQPQIPPHLYPLSDLKTLLRFDKVYSQHYEYAFTQYHEPHFRMGWQPRAINSQTFLAYDAISDIPTGLLIAYGTDEIGWNLYSILELIDYFEMHRAFQNPDTLQAFSLKSIERLLQMCQAIWNPSCYRTIESIEARTRLAQTLRRLIVYTTNSTPSEKNWIQQYCKTIHRENENLDRLFYLGLALRGWMGTGVYPIETAPVLNQDEVDIQVTMKLSDFEENSSMEMLNLPLYIYRGQYQKSSNQDDGLTLQDRLTIIKSGYSGGIKACIRLASNWILSSYAKYCEMCGKECKFDIERLRMVS